MGGQRSAKWIQVIATPPPGKECERSFIGHLQIHDWAGGGTRECVKRVRLHSWEFLAQKFRGSGPVGTSPADEIVKRGPTGVQEDGNDLGRRRNTRTGRMSSFRAIQGPNTPSAVVAGQDSLRATRERQRAWGNHGCGTGPFQGRSRWLLRTCCPPIFPTRAGTC